MKTGLRVVHAGLRLCDVFLSERDVICPPVWPIVTGSSRGVGKGIAIEPCAAQFLSERTEEESDTTPGTPRGLTGHSPLEKTAHAQFNRGWITDQFGDEKGVRELFRGSGKFNQHRGQV
jgi:hypothetical protein